jgi:hypothetical protein
MRLMRSRLMAPIRFTKDHERLEAPTPGVIALRGGQVLGCAASLISHRIAELGPKPLPKRTV